MKTPMVAVLIVLAVAVMIFLNYSNNNGQTSNQASAPPPASSTTKPAVAAPGSTLVPDTTVIDGKTVKLNSYPDGLKYYDTKAGAGAVAASGRTASVQYTGTLLNGTKFNSTADHGGTPFDFAIGGGQVIKGWDEGVAGMRVGGKRRLIIPGNLAYGASPPAGSPITPNATLVFDIELVAIK